MPTTFLFQFSALLAEAEHRPFSVQPSVMTSLLQNLSKVDERYVDIDRPLFARYVPGIRAAMEAGDLEQQIEEERRWGEPIKTQ